MSIQWDCNLKSVEEDIRVASSFFNHISDTYSIIRTFNQESHITTMNFHVIHDNNRSWTWIWTAFGKEYNRRALEEEE